MSSWWTRYRRFSSFDSTGSISCTGLCCQCQVNLIGTACDKETKAGKQHSAQYNRRSHDRLVEPWPPLPEAIKNAAHTVHGSTACTACACRMPCNLLPTIPSETVVQLAHGQCAAPSRTTTCCCTLDPCQSPHISKTNQRPKKSTHTHQKPAPADASPAFSPPGYILEKRVPGCLLNNARKFLEEHNIGGGWLTAAACGMPLTSAAAAKKVVRNRDSAPILAYPAAADAQRQAGRLMLLLLVPLLQGGDSRMLPSNPSCQPACSVPLGVMPPRSGACCRAAAHALLGGGTAPKPSSPDRAADGPRQTCPAARRVSLSSSGPGSREARRRHRSRTAPPPPVQTATSGFAVSK
jgi:hypothetical protein